ncbi:MAG: phage tail protein [Allosphingosinicella sp.]|uniref:phage tail protein n=1 Tax=Allosphingosinicella sp. TaxID=2823234 RepID=UPI00392AA3EF
MADPFVAEIRIYPFNFPPTGWAYCNGQLMPISQNTALFALLGTTYGGDGKSTFALPDMQGNVPMHPGQGPGLSLHDLGESGGTTNVTLLQSEIPFHNHGLRGSIEPADIVTGSSDVVFGRSSAGQAYSNGTPNVAMAPQALAPAGASLPHNNMMPYLTLNFCIALQGVFPPRP